MRENSKKSWDSFQGIDLGMTSSMRTTPDPPAEATTSHTTTQGLRLQVPALVDTGNATLGQQDGAEAAEDSFRGREF